MPEQALNSLPLGTIVHERYRVTATVGRGGLGTVYQVTDVLFGKHNTYALKELVDQSPGARRQFELESQWLQSLDHNHIPKVREHFEWFGRLYLVMDFVDGENLEQKLQSASGRPFPEDQVLRWILPVCDALQYLHSRVPPILHRDIKPANIVMTPAGHVVLVDLGIAKAHIPGGNQTGTFARKAGTEGYAPPEQYTASGQTGPWSDVYALGATLYQLLTGRVPPTAIERVTFDIALIPPNQVNPAISGWVSAALLRALALRPAERFQSVQAFAIALVGPTGRIATLLPNLWLTPPPSPSAPSPIQSSLGVPTPPAIGSWPDLSAVRPPLTPPLTPPSRITDPPARRSSSRAPSEHDRQKLLQLQTQVNAEVSAAARKENEATGISVLSSTTKEMKANRQSRRRSTWFWVTAACAVLLVAAIVAAVIYNASAPPDRSSPKATVSGYFAALEAENFTLAWQFSAAMITDATSQASFIAILAQNDAQLGRVQQAYVNDMTIDNDSSGTTTAQLNVVRAHSPNIAVSNTLILGLYNGNLWLINSITSP
jgi:serine/threonine protein kinase